MLFQDKFPNFKVSKYLKLKSDLGFLKTFVYFYEKPNDPPDSTPLWRRLYPQPNIRQLTDDEKLQAGGVSEESLIWLTDLPKPENYHDRLVTTSTFNVTKYWVIGSNSGDAKAYTTFKIVEKLLVFDVQILRVESINAGDLTIPEQGVING